MQSLASVVLFACLCLSGCGVESDNPDPMSGVTRVGDVLGDTETNGGDFARAEMVRKFDFPRDHGPHPEYRSEWWYLTATMQNSAGDEFGMQFTLFRRALRASPFGDSAWQSGQLYMAHVAITDVAGQRHLYDQRLARGHPASAGVELTPQYRAYLEDWVLEGFVGDGEMGPVELDLKVKSGVGFSLEIHLAQTQPILLQGDRGLSAKGPGQASYYYSIPSMAVRGHVEIAGERHHLAGKGWLDREWSTSVLGSDLVGWDWFAIHLDDNSELTLFQLRRKDCRPDVYNKALALDEYAVRRDFAAGELSFQPQKYWRDAEGTGWPIAWMVTMGADRYQIEAMVPDQIMDTGIRYWEGIVAVSQDGRRIGRGYMEMTGYEGEQSCGG
jgi:predicted secreted hydrolase